MILPIGLIILGAALMKVGFWPRRIGATPHCRKCGYALMGNRSGVCPECGTELSDATVILGERHRRKGFGGAGLVMLLLGLAIGGGLWLSDIDWYRYAPTWWVASDVDSTDYTIARRAWDELGRRRAIGPLGEHIEKKLTQIALAEQANPKPGPLLDVMLNFVGQRYLDGRLSREESEQFFLNTLNADIRTRQIVAAGDPIPVQITYGGRGPSMGWSHRITGQQLKVGDQTMKLGGSVGGSGVGGAGSMTVYANPKPVGQYEVEAQILAEIFQVVSGPPQKPVWSKQITIKKPVNVVAVDREEMVKLIDRPELAESIRKSIKIEKLARKEPGTYELHLQMEKPGTSVAFSVFIRAGGKEYRMGDMTAGPQANVGSFLHQYGLREPLPSKVQVVLRSDAAVARKTIELTEIWKGEIIIDDVEITDEKKP